jgi:hypothetical protein
MKLDLEKLADLPPSPLQETWNGRHPAEVIPMRGADLPGMELVPVRELVPSLPDPIWSTNELLGPTDLDIIRAKTRETLAAMDFSKIQPKKRVNLLANPHAFFMCGEGYAVMLEEIAAHLKASRQVSVKVCLAESMGHIENQNWRKLLHLDERFDMFEEVPQCGAGTEIDTRIGKFHVMQRLFNADYFIHTHVTEMRESYLHRMVDRLYKPFGMAYVRLETRSAYHFGFGPRTGQLVARSVFESGFIQQRFAGAIALDVAPEGVLGIVGDTDLNRLDKKVAADVLRRYGTLIRLMAEIDECVVLFDGHYPMPYAYAGGIIFSNLESADCDFLDLDNLGAVDVLNNTAPEGMTMGHNHAIKAYVINYMAGGLPMTGLYRDVPTFTANPEYHRWMINDPCNTFMERIARSCPDLPTAMAEACAVAGTDKVIIFDHTPGAFRVSHSLARLLRERAPIADADVVNNRLPKWLAQRNLA